MDFKKLKNRLSGKRPLTEGTGFKKLLNRISEASFPWDKFDDRDKPPTWDQRTKAKSAEDSRDFGAIGSGQAKPKPETSSGKPTSGKRTYKFSQFKSQNPELARDLEDGLRSVGLGQEKQPDPNSVEIEDKGDGKLIARFQGVDGEERFYASPELGEGWIYEEDMDDNIFSDFD